MHIKFVRSSVFLTLLFIACSKNNDTYDIRTLVFADNADSTLKAAKDYDFFKQSDHTVLLDEQFDNNSNGWPYRQQGTNTNFPYSYAYIRTGEYHVNGGYSTYLFFAIQKQIDTSKSFEISVRLRTTSQGADGGLMAMSVSNAASGTGFFLESNGLQTLASFYKLANGQKVGNRFSFSGNADDYKELTFRKVRNKVGCFVNRVHQKTYSFSDFASQGNYLGILTSAEMDIDFIKIDYLKF